MYLEGKIQETTYVALYYLVRELISRLHMLLEGQIKQQDTPNVFKI